MKYLFTLILSVCSFLAHAQEKGANQIIVSHVGFREVAMGLLDAGYQIEKSDSVLQTIKTEYKPIASKVKISLFIRIKDSVAIITGKWYNTIVTNTFGKFTTEDNESYPVQNTSKGYKLCFDEMNKVALSFKRPVEYIKK